MSALRPFVFAAVAWIAAASVASAAAIASSISGVVFNDLNGDGIQNAGETGLAGWTVNLDTNADGTVDATTVSGVGGNYSFAGLASGTYRVREVVQAGFVQTSANPADLVLNSTNATVNFGNFQTITISGLKFNDVNGDGVQGAGETGLAGVTIQLDAGANGSVDATVVTGAGGTYSFSNLGPNTYRVREVVPAGQKQTSANPADIVAASGVNVSNINFGNQLLPAGTVPMLDERMLAALAIALAAAALMTLRR